MNLAPIIVTVYHRHDAFKRCIESLQRNDLAAMSELHIVSDGAAVAEHETLVNQVREYASQIKGFKKLHLHFWESNKGSAFSSRSVIQAVLEKHGRMIFMEDDIVVACDFLQYINDGLEHFKDNKKIYSITGYKRPFRIPQSYKHDVFFLENYSPWGFGTWRDRYERVDRSAFDRYASLKQKSELFDRLCKDEPIFIRLLKSDSEGKINAADVKIEYHIHLNKMFSVFPVIARATNEGFDSRGEHCGEGGGFFQADLNKTPAKVNFNVKVEIRDEIARRFYAAASPKLWCRVLRMLQVQGVQKTINFYQTRLLQKLRVR